MEGDYFDYEQNLSTSFDSEQHAKPRKRQRLQETSITDASPLPVSADTRRNSEADKGRSAYAYNFHSETMSPSQMYSYYTPESVRGGSHLTEIDSYKRPPFPQYREHVAPNPSDALDSPAEMSPSQATQYYSYDNHSYAPVQWDPYSYHYQQQFQSQPWANSMPRYHPNGDPPHNNELKHPPPYFHHSTKNERPMDFIPHTAAPYPYYFPNYHHANYPQQQYVPSASGTTAPSQESNCPKQPLPNNPYTAPGVTSTHPAEIPIPRIMSLYMACDEDRLSEYQCLARKQMEVFSATYTDIKMTVQGRNRQILPGQVGIRCRFCSHIPIKKQARASVYYPSKLDCIYQAAQNMASVHLAKYCAYVPETIRNELLRHMKDRKSSAGGGKEYWAVSARSLGIVEIDGRLWYSNDVRKDSTEKQSPNGL